MIFVTIFFLFVSVRICSGIFCNDGSNPCHLDNSELLNSYFLPKNGYYCLDAFNGQVICTCPDNSTARDRPCRICDRNPNPCGIGSSVVTCTDINQSFSCLCNDGNGGLVVLTTPCDNRVVTPAPQEKCDNEGVRDPTTSLCNCPSGFGGNQCELKKNDQLCDKIECKSEGVCAVRPIVTGGNTYQSKCLCRTGFDGEYCERKNVLGTCTSIYCLNGGICQERQVGNSRYKSCQCKTGWNGAQCEKQYFRCKSSGYFLDEYMENQGKYFVCIPYNNELILKQKSCPKGLKYNVDKQLCLHQ